MFSSDILKESTSSELFSERNDAFPSYLYGLLELNNITHKIDTEYECGYYRALKEDSIRDEMGQGISQRELDLLKEGRIADLKKKIIDFINAIIEFIKKFINSLTQKDIKIRRAYDTKARQTNGFINTAHDNDSYTFVIHHYPLMQDINEDRCRQAVQNITTHIEEICDNKFVPAVSDASVKMAYTTLAKLVKPKGRAEFKSPVVDNKSFAEFIKTDVIYNERVHMTYREWREKIYNTLHSPKSVAMAKIKEVEDILESFKTKVSKATIIDESANANVNKLLSYLKMIVTSYTWFINACYEAETINLRYIMNTYDKVKHSTMTESGFIHGEPFNSETLFDNEDMKDFNRTEWLDLQLTTECFQAEFELNEFRRRVALGEAIIMADDDPSKMMRLIAMKEAEGEKTGNKFQNIFAAIKEAISKFFSALKEKSGNFSKFMKNNGQFIDKPIKFQSCSSFGDILAGIGRIQKPLTIIPFNYEQLKEDLKDKKTFFVKHLLSTLNAPSPLSKRDVKWDDNMSITDYCKAYFGAKPSDKNAARIEFSGKEIETNKKLIVQFLNNPGTYQAVDSDTKKLEMESKKVVDNVSSATNNTQQNTNQNDTNNNNQQQQSAKTESMYYSELYRTLLSEAKVEMGENSEANGQNGAQEGNKTSDQGTAFRVYMDCYKDILMSKLTASEYVYHELNDIMKAHAESYMTPEQKAANNNQQPQNNQTNNNANNQQNQ